MDEVSKFLLDEIDGINFLVQEFNFDKCMDLLRLIPSEKLSVNHFEMILALFKKSRHNRKFYDGRKPNFNDVAIIVDRIQSVK